MARIIAIDYGTKRVGIAETDDLKIIASPLTTIHSNEVLDFLLQYHNKYTLEGIVIGEPKSLDNTDTDSTRLINDFAIHIGRKFPEIPVHRVDERFTSMLATQALIIGGASKKQRRNKGLVDALSATIILQSFLEQHKF